MAALADSYGLQFGQAEWLPDVIARYGLNPPRVGDPYGMLAGWQPTG